LAGLLIFSFKFIVLFYAICCLCPEIHFTLVECKGNATVGVACLLLTLQSAVPAIAEAVPCGKSLSGGREVLGKTVQQQQQPFYGPFSRTTRVSRCQKRTFGLWCKGRLTEADTLTIRLGTTLSGLTSAHLHHPPIFFTGRMPFLPPSQQCQGTEGNWCIRIREKTLEFLSAVLPAMLGKFIDYPLISRRVD